jgi:hypothetical protein
MAEQDNGAETPTESAESRLKGAGFVNSMGFWKEPNGERTFSTDEAIAALDAGEIKPFTIPWPGVNPDTVHHFQTTEEEMDKLLGRNQPPPEEPPPLPGWAMPWAELIAEQTAEILAVKVAKKVRPIVKAEIRAALKAQARQQES